jgi:4-hydroxy-4-methyl-2-oxoglutarate aldolase
MTRVVAAANFRSFAELGVSTVYEAAGRTGLVEHSFIRTQQQVSAAGPARTALCGRGDNRAVHEVMSTISPGDVLVIGIERPEPVALLGELLAIQAMTQNAAAVLVDAAVRDFDALAELQLPIWARWVSSTGATKQARGTVGERVRVGGQDISVGDLVILDADGVVVVSADRTDAVLVAARQREERERGLKERFYAGELSYDLYGMRAADSTRSE